MWYTHDNGNSFDLDKAYALVIGGDFSTPTFNVTAYFIDGNQFGLVSGLATLQDAKDLIASLISPSS